MSRDARQWAMFRVTAGDKRAGWTTEQRMEALKRGEDALGTDPVHDFLVIAPDGLMAAALAAAWTRLGATTSDDLPKPFNMVRVEGEVIVVAARGKAKVPRGA